MRSRIIDDRGAWWNAGAWELRSALHLDDVEGDISTVVINNLGFIGVCIRQPSTIVRFRPRTVSRAALSALIYWLARHGCERLCLSFALDGQRQRYEIIPSVRAALLRMEGLIEQERGGPSEPRFVAREGALHRLDRTSRFSMLLDYWRAAGGVFDELDYRPLLARLAGDRYTLFEPDPQGAGFNFVCTGSGLQIPDGPAREALVGSRLDNVADRAYAQWVTRFYRAALESQQPGFHHIRASIRWPRIGSVERKYSRLILPCRTNAGTPVLLGVSGALAAPDLDIEAA